MASECLFQEGSREKRQDAKPGWALLSHFRSLAPRYASRVLLLLQALISLLKGFIVPDTQQADVSCRVPGTNAVYMSLWTAALNPINLASPSFIQGKHTPTFLMSCSWLLFYCNLQPYLAFREMIFPPHSPPDLMASLHTNKGEQRNYFLFWRQGLCHVGGVDVELDLAASASWVLEACIATSGNSLPLHGSYFL